MVQRRGNLFGDVQDRGDDHIGGVGSLLQRRREELQQDIEDISRALRIRSTYVRAIEEGRFQELPGNAYAIGFVRAYADYLGLDGASIVADYREELARRSRQNDLVWPSEGSESRFPGGAILVVCVLLGLVIYGGWYYATQSGGTGIKLIDQVPEYIKKATGVGQVVDQGNPAPVNAATGQVTQGQVSQGQVPQAPGQMPAPTNATTIGAPPATGGTFAGTQPAQPSPLPPSAASAAVPQANAPVAAAPSANAPTGAQNGAPAAVAPAAPPPAVVATPSTNAPGGVVLGQGAAPAAPATPAASGAPATNAPVANAPAVNAPAVTAPAVSAGTAADAAQAPASQAPASQAPASQAPAEQTAAIPAPPPAAKIVIRANRDSWIEIRDPNDNVLFQKVLRQGESYNVPDQKGLIMTTGNAGGIVIELEGHPLQSIGSLGVVKRGIKLDPAALADGSAFNSDDDQ
jgi:cytoskeleton protein RodZ